MSSLDYLRGDLVINPTRPRFDKRMLINKMKTLKKITLEIVFISKDDSKLDFEIIRNIKSKINKEIRVIEIKNIIHKNY